jgi:predicted AAA+ superfamily ATPase
MTTEEKREVKRDEKKEMVIRKNKKMMEERYKKARQDIAGALFGEALPSENVDISEAYQQSRVILGDYVTLDWQHRLDILKIINQIKRYADDDTLRRPLNIIMQAEPGSGKSHMVKCLARKLEAHHAEAVNFNMASLQSLDDLTQPLDSVRNLKVVDRLPILFLDEFDSNQANFAMLLPLMWDGELHIGHRDLKLGKLVIILAGSGKNIEEVMKSAKAMQTATAAQETKLVDLLSRINGGELEIPALDMVSGDRDRRVDKVCLTVALLQNRFANKLEVIPWALLRFVVMSKFRYGVRSIAHLVDLVSPLDEDASSMQLSDLNLPLQSVPVLRDSSLAYHVFSEDGPAAIIELWTECCKSDIAVRIKKEGEEEEDF